MTSDPPARPGPARRSSIGILLLACCAAASCAPPPAPVNTPEAPAAPRARKARYDAVIVGAGIAGLTAAKVLRGAGLEVVVLEASDRIGGRAVTTEVLGKKAFEAPVDLGGAWIHGVRSNPLTPIAAGMGFRTTRTDVEASEHLFFRHRFAKPDEAKAFREADEAFGAALEEALDDIGDDAPGKDGRRYATAADFLGEATAMTKDPTIARLLALNAGPLEGGTELVHSSIEDATDFISEDDDFINEGFGTFVEKLGEEIKPFVRLRLPVTRITDKVGTVLVEAHPADRVEECRKNGFEGCKAEEFEALKVLVTVSTGVLAKKKIEFRPDLPSQKWDAIHALPMGLMNKVILQLSTPDVFPEQDGKRLKNTWVLYGGDDESGKDDLAFVLRPMDTNIAVGFFGGARARELEAMPDKGKQAMVDVAMRALLDMCKATRGAGKCDVYGALVKTHTTAWGSEPWTLGAYSAALPGMARMREELSEPVNFNIYFAGEACYNSTYNGTFAGAYNSALRAGAGMVDCLGREKRGVACVWEQMTHTMKQD